MSTLQYHQLETNGWNEFPFEINGVSFVSKIAPDSPFMPRIKNLPAGVFDSMNKDAVLELVGTNLSREYVASKLFQINKGATHAVIELA